MSARRLAVAPIRDLFGGMNKTEKVRALELESMKRNGSISEWWFERWTFKLGDDLRYTPDFIIQYPDGSLLAEEVKGFWRDDARAKVRMFAATFPIRIMAMVRVKNGWDVETF